MRQIVKVLTALRLVVLINFVGVVERWTPVARLLIIVYREGAYHILLPRCLASYPVRPAPYLMFVVTMVFAMEACVKLVLLTVRPVALILVAHLATPIRMSAGLAMVAVLE